VLPLQLGPIQESFGCVLPQRLGSSIANDSAAGNIKDSGMTLNTG
jgi:hypothetical protein